MLNNAKWVSTEIVDNAISRPFTSLVNKLVLFVFIKKHSSNISFEQLYVMGVEVVFTTSGFDAIP